MFIITNREIDENATGLDAFGSSPNSKGPNELRLAEAEWVGGKWRVEVLPDRLSAAKIQKEKLAATETDENGNPIVFASRYAAKKVSKRLEELDRNLVFFVHGYNNDLKAVLDRAQGFEDLYNVEVVVFSWPANGGGFVGTASYLSDKRDALASVGALDRCLAKLHQYMSEFNAERIKKIEAEATARFPNDAEKWDKFFTKMNEKGCPFTVNMVLHSMGNYLFKHVLQSAAYRGDLLLFDNVVLVAADANNDGHAEWVDRIQARNRVFITINEDDGALRASRMKAGEEQRARLGHYPYNLYAERAVYVDFTNAPYVSDSHAYFEGKPVINKIVKKFFQSAFNGERAEDVLTYEAARRLYNCR